MTMHDRDDHRAPGPRGLDDEPLDGWLQALADDYHRPPATPRDQMWARIQAARAQAAAPAAAEAAPPTATPTGAAGDELAARRERRAGGAADRWTRGLLALAATLLLAVALGRHAGGRGDGGVPSLAAPPTTVARASDAPATPGAAAPAPATPAMPAMPAMPQQGAAGGQAAPRQGGEAPAPTLAAAPRPAASQAETAAVDETALAAPLQVAAVQHLGEVEFLLTSFRLDADGGEALPALQPWAQELLTTTRLMLDSPVGRDRQLGPLLGSLEVVLTQIAQLPAARAAEERQLIARSLERNDLMTQLRTAVPAGPARAQRSGD